MVQKTSGDDRLHSSAIVKFRTIVRAVVEEILEGDYRQLEHVFKCMKNPQLFATWMISVTGVNDEAGAEAAAEDVFDELNFSLKDALECMNTYRLSEAARLDLAADASWDKIKRILSNQAQDRLKSQGGVM